MASAIPPGPLRRRGFRIPRFARLGKARSLHRSSSPTQTRFAGLCVGGRLRRPVWVENFSWCGSIGAPGFFQPTLPVRDTSSAPFGGTFPLLGGRLSGGRKGRPYIKKQIRIRSVSSAKPGAAVEPHQPQFSTQIGRRRRPPTQSPAQRVCVGEEEQWSERALPNRAKRGIRNPRRRRPQWAGGNLDCYSDFARRKCAA